MKYCTAKIIKYCLILVKYSIVPVQNPFREDYWHISNAQKKAVESVQRIRAAVISAFLYIL